LRDVHILTFSEDLMREHAEHVATIQRAAEKDGKTTAALLPVPSGSIGEIGCREQCDPSGVRAGGLLLVGLVRSEREVIMDLRYLGFDQQGNTRAYRFDGITKGETTKHFTITAEISLFLVHHISIQEGPTLCAQKLAADLRNNALGVHALTDDDLRRHIADRAVARTQEADPQRTAHGRWQEALAFGLAWQRTRP
jgi:hypothetical protein